MKNMKVSLKLTVSFLVVIGLAIIVGALGIFGMYRINEADDAMYNGNYLPTIMVDEISQNIVEQRVYMRNFVIYDVDEDAEIFQSTAKSMDDSKKDMEELFAEYEQTITNPDDRKAFDEFIRVYNYEWMPLFDTIYSLGVANKTQEAKSALTTASPLAVQMDDLSDKLQEFNISDGEESVNSNTALFNTMTFWEIVALIIAVGAALFFAYYISSLINKPLLKLKTTMDQIGNTGSLEFSDEMNSELIKVASGKDEIAQSIAASIKTIQHFEQASGVLRNVASGDLSDKFAILSEEDTIGVSLNQMLDNMNSMFADIRTASEQVSSGANQVSQGAQELASGSSEQAASIEELSASLSELQEKTDHNADDSTNAKNANYKTAEKLEDSIRSMSTMLDAMKSIDESSGKITKVIKVIDDIAFQTNILALNAAVEAARAGQHGKGFAVVADEVRNLAAKSAEAAKETSALIAGSSDRVKEGNKIVAETNSDLEAAVENARESTRLIEQVASASLGQAKSIAEINLGMDQISSVVQANSATAEQSAAASEEMSAQAVLMNEIVSKFKLRQSGYQSIDTSGQNFAREQSKSTGFAIAGSKY